MAHHNHLSFNLLKSVFDFPTKPFGELAMTIRLAVFEAAARARLPGLIFTCVYANPEDDPFIVQVVELIARAIGKIDTVKSLRGMLARWNLTSAIAGRVSLDIDNSTLAPEAAARRIAEHFALPTAGGQARGGVRS